MFVRRIILVALAAAAAAIPAAAMANDADVKRNGTCTRNSSAKIKLSPENGRIETEFEVDQNRNGVRWRVVLFRNGTRVASRAAVTRAPSGSFDARFVSAGAGRFVPLTAAAHGDTLRRRCGDR